MTVIALKECNCAPNFIMKDFVGGCLTRKDYNFNDVK